MDECNFSMKSIYAFFPDVGQFAQYTGKKKKKQLCCECEGSNFNETIALKQ